MTWWRPLAVTRPVALGVFPARPALESLRLVDGIAVALLRLPAARADRAGEAVVLVLHPEARLVARVERGALELRDGTRVRWRARI